MINIYVTSYKPSEYTKLCLESILDTAIQPYSLTVISTLGSAAINKNLAINMCKADELILLDDDIIFRTKGWNMMLLDDLRMFPMASVVGCRVIEVSGYKTMSYQACDNAIVDNVRITGCALAIRKTNLRYDEDYTQSQCDDISFCLDTRERGNSVLCDTRVRVTHLKPSANAIAEDHPNVIKAYKQWGKDEYLGWGRNPEEFKVLKEF